MTLGQAKWDLALASYRYKVDVGAIAKALSIQNFPFDTMATAQETKDLEGWFYEHRDDLKAWLVVVRWKMASQGGRSRLLADRVQSHWKKKEVVAQDLVGACERYINMEDVLSFRGLLSFFPFQRRIAVVATFPAFFDPDRFGMVDTRIAKWAIERGDDHGLTRPPKFGVGSQTTLSIDDFPFVVTWEKWCRNSAQKLGWRARDVEMAVFRAWGDRHPLDSIDLEVLP